MIAIGSMTVALSEDCKPDVLEGSCFPCYVSAKNYWLDTDMYPQCQQCLRRFCSFSWLVDIDGTWYTACSKDCTEQLIQEHSIVCCDNCAGDVERSQAMPAIVHNTPVQVCSSECLARLHHVWQGETMTRRLLKRLKRYSKKLHR